MDDLLINILSRISNVNKEEGDYVENGLLLCGKCKTPKQHTFYDSAAGVTLLLPCSCKCEKERRDKAEKEKQEREAKYEREMRDLDFSKKVKGIKEAGIMEKRLLEWNFKNDDMTNPKLTNAMKKYVNGFDSFMHQGKGLLIHGSVGTGKTYAACEVANKLIDKGYPVLITNFSRLTNTLQGMMKGKQDYLDSLNSFDLLVIDDLGTERRSEFMQEQVYLIVDSRYRAGLPMIITTNLSMAEVTKPDDVSLARIYDRILETCYPIEVTGKSRRREKLRSNYDKMKEALGI